MRANVSSEVYSLGVRKGTPLKKSASRQKVLDAMSSRCVATSLEPFLGTYRIVWDSESNCDPRDVLLDDSRGDRDVCDGLLTLTRPQCAHAWPKEPTTSTGVVLRLCDSFLGTNRTASLLKSSLPPVSKSSSSLSLSASLYAASASSLSLLSSPQSSPLLSPLSQASLYSISSRDSYQYPTTSPGFWRFDWDPSFPRLGFRFEGMDLTGPRGHALSFSDIRDDRGHPFAVLEFRPTGWDAGEHDGRRHRSAAECVKRRAGYGARACCILVVAQRVRDRYDREGLSEAERERLGMREFDDARFS
ncbi:hypothetical protein PYCCODRAFT_1431146 [Trametes coccinea BRFM310]|uniref:Uncharacterized protein n=1 Tax=Trametes coccinea (strain BRFM310) TaxID=1353009 RepID=A0A1Y2J3C8_TRAC3|nr:hypothetical protein PYCCODRAFT_1431146 [Trametes coccinea BRFM310]